MQVLKIYAKMYALFCSSSWTSEKPHSDNLIIHSSPSLLGDT